MKLDCNLKSFVAWPANRVMFLPGNTNRIGSISPHSQSVETPPAPAKKSQASSQSPTQLSQESTPEAAVKENQKCLLMDLTGKKVVVAEGRWSTNNPDLEVHFVPLGPNAVRVWVDIVKVHDVRVWRPSSFIECLDDAIDSTIAWPEDKVVIV